MSTPEARRDAEPHLYTVAVEGAVFHRGRYLFVVRSRRDRVYPGVLTLPGGKVEIEAEGESVLERSVRREVSEEAGVEVEDDVHYVESKTFRLDDGRHVLDAVFLCRYRAGVARPDARETEAVVWLSPEELARRPDAQDWLIRSVALAEVKRRALGWQ
ncbi:MAG: NUDIX domain-containing protein [Anaerolineae bacterium]|nr:NUDIX domain-containing protein [Anaerolineae bacterium]